VSTENNGYLDARLSIVKKWEREKEERNRDTTQMLSSYIQKREDSSKENRN
jgi:hypothetical protein